ncbi:MAG TPA: hypothetical protein VG101_09780 [Puia sp.]|jgi:hypothetical protein|nr:hypothetical protein [Puia sp.]
MPIAKKNTASKVLKKRNAATVVVIKSRIDAKDTLFPEKVAKANEILTNTKKPRFRS